MNEGPRSCDGVAVHPAAFADQPADRDSRDPSGANLDIILDVTVPVTVSIGSVGKTVSEILALTPGQVIDLDRAAGDPVDLFVHDRLVARGEVVVVGDRYGFRVTEIVPPSDRFDAGRG
ncbi:MAG TPA: flagellar motor switch protein FliN [Planctomycetota bacterium]|nr:flagellar motor switch protein FliN [Planctomycetota bacterium]